MTTHTTPPRHADNPDEAEEQAPGASRFDERGIALQTVIIMVVLLAIAGSVAAVLLTRGSQATSRLENQEVIANFENITSYQLCVAAGGTPSAEALGTTHANLATADNFQSCRNPT